MSRVLTLKLVFCCLLRDHVGGYARSQDPAVGVSDIEYGSRIHNVIISPFKTLEQVVARALKVVDEKRESLLQPVLDAVQTNMVYSMTFDSLRKNPLDGGDSCVYHI